MLSLLSSAARCITIPYTFHPISPTGGILEKRELQGQHQTYDEEYLTQNSNVAIWLALAAACALGIILWKRKR